MTIEELEVQLLALTARDKAEAISILTQSLKNSGRPITKTPEILTGKVIRVYRSGPPSLS